MPTVCNRGIGGGGLKMGGNAYVINEMPQRLSKEVLLEINIVELCAQGPT